MNTRQGTETSGDDKIEARGGDSRADILPSQDNRTEVNLDGTETPAVKSHMGAHLLGWQFPTAVSW